MARPKKSQNKTNSVSSKGAPKAEDITSLGEVVEDAVILEESDQVGVPEAAGEENAAKNEPDSDPEISESVTDTEAEVATEPETRNAENARTVSVTEPPTRSGGRFFTMLLGGACAAAVGFGAAQYSSGSWPFAAETPDYDALSGQILTLSEGLAALHDRLGEATAVQSDIDAIRAGQDTAQQAVSTLTQTLGDFDQRLTDLENRPIPDVGATRDAVSAYQEQLAGMRAMFEGELKRIETAQARSVEQEQTAAERAEVAMQRSALAQLKATLDSGASYTDALETLSGAVEIPPALVENAANGIPTLAQLQRSFPAAARDALDASIRSQADAGEMDSLTAFMRTQLGARSLEPKEGDDPDAVLSRAEAALRDGDLSGTITELQSLPETGRDAMAEWSASAQTRHDAVAAYDLISASLNN